ncbi:MAG: hypothetical protein ABH886_07995 [Candidatus Desantisbacteria bacterium]
MNDTELKQKIRSTIQAFKDSNVSESSLILFQALGYDTNRQSPFSEKTYRFFKDSYESKMENFKEKKSFCGEWKYVDLLFQISEEEAKEIKAGRFNDKEFYSFLFFVIELSGVEYSRTTLSQITRELNKVFPMPVMVLFKYGQLLTLAVINRRLHKQDEQKDVLEKVTLIKDISIGNPHRAHIEILFDLSFDELRRIHKFTNFVELHNAWQKTLDTKELNKRFYQELFNWYLWALPQVKFPQIRPKKDMVIDKVHQSESLIRLLTRILFVWFMKSESKELSHSKFRLHR